MGSENDWPLDVDGDVFRRMHEHGFDFDKVHAIEFNIEFRDWPPSNDALIKVKNLYQNVRSVDPDGDFPGYFEVTVHEKVTYPFVIKTQVDLTTLVTSFGGFCESWGVMQESN